MAKQTIFATAEAGHKFLELYAEPVVTNTYLKVAILVLSVVALALLALLYRAQTAALQMSNRNHSREAPGIRALNDRKAKKQYGLQNGYEAAHSERHAIEIGNLFRRQIE